MIFRAAPGLQKIAHILAILGLFGLFPTISLADEVEAAPTISVEAAENVVWLGLYLSDEVDGGVRVRAVVPDSPAALAGLRSGDLLVSAGSSGIGRQVDLERLLARYEPGSSLELSGFRNGTPLKATVMPVVSSRPPTAPQPRSLPRTAVTPSLPAPAWLPARDPMRRLLAWTQPGRELYVGMQIVELTPELRLHYGSRQDRGVLVLRVEANSPAAQAGVRVGDVLTEIDRQPIAAPAGLWSSLALWPADLPLPIGLIRNRDALVAELRLLKPTTEGAAASSSRPAAKASSEALEREIERLERRLELLRKRLNRPQD